MKLVKEVYVSKYFMGRQTCDTSVTSFYILLQFPKLWKESKSGIRDPSTSERDSDLGLSWLKTHNPTMDWCNRSITFLVRPIPARSLHSIESVAVEFGLVTALAVSSRDVFVLVNDFPTRYNDFADIFEKQNVNQLSPHRPYDCPIKLQASNYDRVRQHGAILE